MVVEIKNSVVVFVGLVVAIILALLPGAYILWAVIAVPVVGALGLLVFLGTRATKKKANLMAAVIFLLVLGAIGPSVLLMGGLLYLLAASIAMFLFPTALNLGFSYLVAQALPDRRILIIPVFLIASLALAFNVRIPGMLDDLFNANKLEQSSVTRIIQLTQNEPLLLVSNVEKISFRDSPHEPIGLGGNEGCMCFYWTYPGTIVEDVEDALQRSGIRYTKSGNARHRLVIDSHEMDGTTFLEINLWDGPKKTASYKTSLRSYYQHEEGFGTGYEKDVDYLPHRLLFLAQNSIWNHALSSATRAKTKHPIRSFLEKSIRVSPPPGQVLAEAQPIEVVGEVEPLTTYNPYIGKQDYANIVGSVEAGCGNRIQTGLRYDTGKYGSVSLTGSTVTFREGTERFTVLVMRDLERVKCATSAVYVIGSLTNQVVRIQKFSREGGLLADHVITLPKMTFVGSRKRIVEFSELGGRYEFTLLNIAEEGHYYAVKGAYHIRAPLNNDAIQPGIDS